MRHAIFLLIVVSLAGLHTFAAASDTFRWVDRDGNVHYGDRVPPEYADQRSDVLNRHGVAIGARDGARSEAQRAADDREAESEAARIAQQRRDRVLLDTYLSVEEIHMLRDRRLELLQAQIDVTAGTLERLYQQLQELEQLAEEYRPYNTSPEAPRIPQALAAELAGTQASVLTYERTLTQGRRDQEALVARFDADADRFLELQQLRRSRGQ
jgi:hypothetical protein